MPGQASNCSVSAGSSWFVYVLVSSSTGHTYVGVTTDPTRRLAEHNDAGPASKGAKRTRAGRPWQIARLHGPIESQSEAQKLEARIKKERGHTRLEVNP